MIETEPFLLHPLVVLGISDHYVRAKINNNVKEPTFGGVVGTRSAGGGCCTELQATFELALTGSGDAVDTELAEARAEQYRKVFPEYVFLGWYAVAPVSDTLMSQLTGLAEGSGRVLLVFDPARADGRDTQVEAYTVEDARRLRRLPLKVVASDPERIGVDHIIRCSDATEAPQCKKKII